MADLHGERFREMIEELDDGHIYGKRSRDSRVQGGRMKTEAINRIRSMIHDSSAWEQRDFDEAETLFASIETALAAKDDAIASSCDVMSEVIQHGLEIGSADWAQMKKCKDALMAALTTPEECEWVQEDPFGSGDSCIWQTACGHEFVFDEGTPSDNGAKWCLYCGKKLVERAVEDTQ